MIIINWVKGILRNIFMFVFYVTPLGWIYILGGVYLDIVDWLTLPFDEKVKRHIAIKNRKDETAMDIAVPLFSLARLFKGGRSVPSE